MPKSNGNRYSITIDDDPNVAKLIEKSIQLPTLSFSSGEALLGVSFAHQPVAVFIDIHLGVGTSGLNLIPSLRERWPYSALIVVTGDTSDDALSKALALGADDFIQKPIRPAEVSARLQSRLGDLAEKEAKNIIRISDITLHCSRRTLKGKCGQTFLSPTAMLLLVHLIQAKGSVINRLALKQRAWGKFAISDNALDRKIHEIRRALKDVSTEVRMKTSYGNGFSIEISQATTAAEPKRKTG